MNTDELITYFTDRKKFCTLMAKISLFAAVIFVAYGWMINQMQTLIIGIFFLICFFGFWYAKQRIGKVEQERTFYGTQPDPATHLNVEQPKKE